jgi:hypothetical protein
MTVDDSEQPMAKRCHHEGDTAHALFAAVAQIALALRESQNPVAELGSLLARQAQTLAAVRAGVLAQAQATAAAAPSASESPANGAGAPNGAAPPNGAGSANGAGASNGTSPTAPASEATAAAALSTLVDQLQAEVFKGIQQLQFYDRQVQHLTHVQDYLIAVANELDTFKAQSQSQDFWEALHAKFRKRLISDEQRGLLDLFVMPDVATRVSAQAVVSADYSPPGDFEMF